jgi:hypothetical protein
MLLATIDESLDALGDWDNADVNFRYHSNEKVNIVGIQPCGEQSDFWKKHFAGFAKTTVPTVPTVIDTSHLHQPPKGRQNNRVHPSYIDIACGHGHADNDIYVMSRTADETVTQQTRPRTVPSPGSQVSLTQQAGLASPPSEGAMSGLANMKRKLALIDKDGRN